MYDARRPTLLVRASWRPKPYTNQAEALPNGSEKGTGNKPGAFTGGLAPVEEPFWLLIQVRPCVRTTNPLFLSSLTVRVRVVVTVGGESPPRQPVQPVDIPEVVVVSVMVKRRVFSWTLLFGRGYFRRVGLSWPAIC